MRTRPAPDSSCTSRHAVNARNTLPAYADPGGLERFHGGSRTVRGAVRQGAQALKSSGRTAADRGPSGADAQDRRRHSPAGLQRHRVVTGDRSAGQQPDAHKHHRDGRLGEAAPYCAPLIGWTRPEIMADGPPHPPPCHLRTQPTRTAARLLTRAGSRPGPDRRPAPHRGPARRRGRPRLLGAGAHEYASQNTSNRSLSVRAGSRGTAGAGSGSGDERGQAARPGASSRRSDRPAPAGRAQRAHSGAGGRPR